MKYSEKFNRNFSDADSFLKIKTVHEEVFPRHFRGEVVDKIINHRTGEITYLTGHNVVVKDASRLIATLMKNQAGYSGIQYWAVGTGEASWDTTPPAEDENTTKLVNEIYRKAPDSIKWITTSNEESSTPTNRLEVVCTFTTSQGNGSWREFGLFGGNATGTANSGLMINHKIHSVITKTPDMSIERTLRFIF